MSTSPSTPGLPFASLSSHETSNPLVPGISRFVLDGERRQLARLERVRRERDNAAVAAKLAALREAAAGRANLMPFLLDAVTAYATLQEMMDVLRGVFGIYQEPVIL